MEVLELEEKKLKVKPINSLIKSHPFATENIYYNTIEGRANINNSTLKYNTNYDIVVDGELLQSNRQQSCFSYLTGASSDSYRETYLINPYHKNKQVIAYGLSEDINLKASEIRKWIKLMRTLNLPFKFKELYAYSLSCRSFGETPAYRLVARESYAKQKVYAIIINYDDYTSVEQFKILLYLFRYIYEANLFEVVRNVIKYQETYKGDFDFMKTFFYIDSFTKRASHAHLINQFLFTDITTEKFVEYIKSFNDSKEKYINVLMTSIDQHFNYYSTKVSYQIGYGHNTYQNYSNIIYNGIVEDYKVIDYTVSIEDNLESLINTIKSDESSLYLVTNGNVKLLGLEIDKIVSTKSTRYTDLNDEDEEDGDDYYGYPEDDDDDY